MTHTGIECFLAICRHKTGSAAAEVLYITQPSLSARLKALEQELGFSLFFRCKGSREMVLTPAGQEFYPLAVQYASLMEQMRKLGSAQASTLRISCFNSLGTYLLPDVYKLFLQSNPTLNLQVQDMELAAASQSILQGQTDLAFTSGHVTHKRLHQVPAFSEPMVLVCAADTPLQSPVKLSALPASGEVCVHWSHDFTRWHETVLGNANPRLCVSIMAQLRQFLEREGQRSIIPVSVAKGLAAECAIVELETDIPLPRREVSYITAAGSQIPALDTFLSCLRQVLTTYPEIEILL